MTGKKMPININLTSFGNIIGAMNTVSKIVVTDQDMVKARKIYEMLLNGTSKYECIEDAYGYLMLKQPGVYQALRIVSMEQK